MNTGKKLTEPLRIARRRIRRATEQMRVRNTLIYANLAVLGERYGYPQGLAGKELRVFSQNGEDGVLAEIFHRIGTTTGFFVEFGVGGGLEGNSVLLADVHRWEGLFIEGSPTLHAQLQEKYEAIDQVRVLQALVSAENVEDLFASADVPADLDLLSIDIDSNDYWVWKAINTYRPSVVVIEYNGSPAPTATLTQPYRAHEGWDGTDFYGCSLGALDHLGTQKGYRLIHADLTGTNAFFVRDDLASLFEDCFPVLARRASTSFTDFRHTPDPRGRVYVDVRQ